ncbi:hypothetical protein ACFX2C_040685 [Malus domestica]
MMPCLHFFELCLSSILNYKCDSLAHLMDPIIQYFVALFTDGSTAGKRWYGLVQLLIWRQTVEEGSDYCAIIPEKLNATAMDTYNDHRMGMAFSLLPVEMFPDTFKFLGKLAKH